MRVLLVDDEPSIISAVGRSLRMSGCEVHTAMDGVSALAAAGTQSMDVIILDVALPDIDGLDVCRRIRGLGDQTPILMLTARDSVGDRVSGLDAGADDYLTKPFSTQELLARVRALVRRAGAGTLPRSIRVGDLYVDSAARVAMRADRVLPLTRTEFALLELFVRHVGEALPRKLIYQEVWGFDMRSTSNSLDVYIGYLRRKLEADGEPRILHTVRGVGFRLGGASFGDG
jgi:two-component system response regulator MprA